MTLSPAQRRALRFAKTWMPLRDGSIEQGLQLGITGAALEAVIKSLERKRLVDANGDITDAGRAALDTHPPYDHNPDDCAECDRHQ